MVRIPFVAADTAEPRELVDAIRARRGGHLAQVDRVLLHCPNLANGWNTWVGAIRVPTALSPFHKELATCAVSVLARSEFELARHTPVFLREGGTEAQLDALLGGIEDAAANAAVFDTDERAILGLALAMTRDITVTQEVYDAAREAVGSPQGIVELASIIVTYNMTTRFASLFDLDVFGDPLPARPGPAR